MGNYGVFQWDTFQDDIFQCEETIGGEEKKQLKQLVYRVRLTKELGIRIRIKRSFSESIAIHSLIKKKEHYELAIRSTIKKSINFSVEMLFEPTRKNEAEEILDILKISKKYEEDIIEEMDIKEWVGFDTKPSLGYILEKIDNETTSALEGADLSRLERKKIMEILRNAIERNWSIRRLTLEINKVIDDNNRAYSIARTETVRLANEGKIERYEQEGIADKVKFIAAPDERTCEICSGLDGKTFTLSEAKGFIPEKTHPQCRCTFVPV